ncbi:hypothetical protein M9H77_16814 [Catharanthus roseus]|uniref:Uncharacterized protein n=1 Tax=Catharanthus roseus TaxID=4058 RepID=A0ACC0B2T1_CATRO|nr:hypothetical protein M9H77_16814 [Catharanthus roseus]
MSHLTHSTAQMHITFSHLRVQEVHDAPPPPSVVGLSFDVPPPPSTASTYVTHMPISRASSSDSNEHGDNPSDDTYENDEDDDDPDEDYDVLIESDDDNNPNDEEDDISTPPLDDLIESGTIRLLDWNYTMTNLQLGMRIIEKIQAISAAQKWSIRIGREFRVVKSLSKQASKYDFKIYSKLILHLVANDPEIPVSNIIQEVQLWQMQEYTLSYSHALAVCKDNGTRPNAYVTDI